MTIPYKYTETGELYILGYNGFETEYLNQKAYEYGYRTNRTYGDTLKLPYDIDDVKVLPNEIINSDTINSKLELLYKNYVYALTQCSIGKIDGLEDFRGSTHFPSSLYDAPISGLYKTEYTPQTTDSLLDRGVRSIALCPNITPGVDSLVVATGNRLLLCKFEPVHQENSCHNISMISTSASEILVDSENDLEFKSIKKIVTNRKGGLYTLDTGRNIIYKHNIRGLTRGDRILNSKQTAGRMLDVMVGKSGDLNSKVQFANPIDMTHHRDRLYVLDGGSRNYRIKVYDDQINWLNTYNISLDFIKYTPVSMSCNTDSLYILTDSGQLVQYDISEMDRGYFSPVRSTKLSIIDVDYNLTEKYIEIKFSTTNDNILYVVTNKSVYKMMVDKLGRPVGHVDWVKHNITTTDVSPICIDIIERQDTVGLNVLVMADVKINVPGRDHETLALHFTDGDNLMHMLNPGYETNIIKYENITINSEEYVSPFVYNKTISKMLHNLNMLYDSTIYIVSDEITGTGEYKYPGVRYVSEDEIKNLRIQDTLKDTMYIGVNELVSSSTLNRCFSDIISKQSAALHLIRDRKNNSEFYYKSINRLKRLPVKVVESYLQTGYRYRIQKIE